MGSFCKVLRLSALRPFQVRTIRRSFTTRQLHGAPASYNRQTLKETEDLDAADSDGKAEDFFQIAPREHPVTEKGNKSSASFETNPYKLYLLENGPQREATMTRTEGLEYFRQMTTLRQLSNTTRRLFADGHMRGRIHHHNGQEASCVGVEAAITKADSMVSSYRTMGWCYVRGVELRKIIGEMAGRSTGLAEGKAGAMLMRGPGFYGGHAVVGAQVPIGAGIAFAYKYRNENNVCITLYGDGASNQGQVYETFNMAKLWDLPCVFVCENNGYALYTDMTRSSAYQKFYKKGHYIPGIWADGMDVLAVRDAVRFAKQHALTQGPIIVELENYLYQGHSISHPDMTSRTCEVVEKRKGRDPIDIHVGRMISADLASHQELTELAAKCKTEVEAVAEKCLADPIPGEETIYTHVYKDVGGDFYIRGCDTSRRHSPNDGSALPNSLDQWPNRQSRDIVRVSRSEL